MGGYSTISFPAFVREAIFGKPKWYLSRQHDSGSSPAASHLCTTCNYLSEKCHSRCCHHPRQSAPWCCSGSHSTPCRSLWREKSRRASQGHVVAPNRLFLVDLGGGRGELVSLRVTCGVQEWHVGGRDAALEAATASQWLSPTCPQTQVLLTLCQQGRHYFPLLLLASQIQASRKERKPREQAKNM